MISVSDVSFSYGYEPVFEKVSFSVPNGKKVGLVGPNGAGKSTLFKLLTKQEFPSGGKVEVTGSLVMVQQEVKYDPALQTAKTIEEFVDPTHQHNSSAIGRILDGLDFDRSKASNDLTELSGGQKTKLALARAFLAKPDILLLDEPTNFLSWMRVARSG
jgi:ATPase subunit of ABC transporter with duplicated ATPase domains